MHILLTMTAELSSGRWAHQKVSLQSDSLQPAIPHHSIVVVGMKVRVRSQSGYCPGGTGISWFGLAWSYHGGNSFANSSFSGGFAMERLKICMVSDFFHPGSSVSKFCNTSSDNQYRILTSIGSLSFGFQRE